MKILQTLLFYLKKIDHTPTCFQKHPILSALEMSE